MIALGYGIGPWFGKACDSAQRSRCLLMAGIASLLGFAMLRTLNVYGDAPWLAGTNALQTLMSWFNVTKYPPSLLFLMLTLGIGLLLLCAFENAAGRTGLQMLATLGAAPMFFMCCTCTCSSSCTWRRWRSGGQPGTVVRTEQPALAVGDRSAAGRGSVSRSKLVCRTQAAPARHYLAQVPLGSSHGTILPPVAIDPASPR